ncbi:MAG: type II toxin-antitoxin system VapC family toxin [Ginsengibacter sp.]
MNTNDKKIYLDANFLIFWALPKDNEIKKKVRVHLATFLSTEATLATSCLAIDEAWNGVKKTYNVLNNETKSCSDEPIFSSLEKFTKELLNKVLILQFENPINGTIKALENIKSFKLKPRDSFHLSLMQDNSFDEIITDDRDFEEIKDSANIKVNF